ncbi:MAG: 6-methylsalicylate decarboxylase [Thermoleophilaceae bacterium]|nr:6-methylsalicylate decarboxylase [Thermoleophilaceae bacterium]
MGVRLAKRAGRPLVSKRHLRYDIHQHLLTDRVIGALASRTEAPCARRDGGRWMLRIAGEPDYPIEPSANDPDARAELVDSDGVDRALICLSSVLGIEALPRAEAAPLLDAYADGTKELPDVFGSWAAVGVADPEPDELDARLDAGHCGLAVPAGALAGAAELEHLAPLLERLERRDAPLLVHPGPGPRTRAAELDPHNPHWWPALTRYVTEMSHAWHAFVAFGRPQHPRLRVVFVMLAGLAPLHLERLIARGGPAEIAIDQNVFFDTSSYGPQAIDALVRVQGVDQVVYGSDRPVVEPRTWTLGEAAHYATLVANPARLLGSREVEQ